MEDLKICVICGRLNFRVIRAIRVQKIKPVSICGRLKISVIRVYQYAYKLTYKHYSDVLSGLWLNNCAVSENSFISRTILGLSFLTIIVASLTIPSVSINEELMVE